MSRNSYGISEGSYAEPAYESVGYQKTLATPKAIESCNTLSDATGSLEGSIAYLRELLIDLTKQLDGKGFLRYETEKVDSANKVGQPLAASPIENYLRQRAQEVHEIQSLILKLQDRIA